MDERTQYALGIVTLFPSLKDPYSKKGYVSMGYILKLGSCNIAFVSLEII